ncbi:MAG: DUF421 domain-containing protein, partial [Clostridia bacterium]|nr:DUF421 domain-containing protein [Clostridia bacterium]
ILYFVIMLAIRLMGKRQIGEMQPTELVVTILISEIAAIPLDSNDIPLINSILTVLLFAGLSILTSVLTLHLPRFREVFDGHPAIVINNGKLDQKKMKDLRLTVQDILSAARQQGVFEIEQIQYAIVETNGAVSIMLKAEHEPLTAYRTDTDVDQNVLQHLIICDGKLIHHALRDSQLSAKELEKHLKKEKLRIDQIMMLTYGSGKFGKVIRKEKV